MRAFDKVFEILTNSKMKYGHTAINELNRRALRRANNEISDMLKKCNIEKQNDSLAKEISPQEDYLVS